jgi:hypothetical protein
MGEMRGRVEISIGELVLEGFAPSEKYRIGEAVQLELARLFGERANASDRFASGARDAVDAGAFTMNSSRGEVIGAQIARAVFDSFRNQE